ncbi:19802_t:CDS:2, partial [Racocetra persica]
KEKQQQITKLGNKQEELYEVTQKMKIEDEEPYKNLQEHTETSQEEKKKEEQAKRQEEDVEMDRKESKQGSTLEEKERQKRRKSEIEEEIDIKREIKGKQRKYNEEYLRERNNASENKEKEYEEEKNKAKIVKDCHETDKRSDNRKYLTIWDLSTNINKKELEYICRKFKEAQIVRIKRSKFKTFAVVTKGEEDHEAREKQKKYTAKLTELPENALEILLLRSLKRMETKEEQQQSFLKQKEK